MGSFLIVLVSNRLQQFLLSTDMIANMNTNMNSTMKTGAQRAERSEASEAPPLHRHDYENEHAHEHEYELHNENGRRASRAKRGDRGALPLHRHDYEHEREHELHNENGRRARFPPCTDMNTNRDHFLNTFRKWSSLKPDPSLLGFATGMIFNGEI